MRRPETEEKTTTRVSLSSRILEAVERPALRIFIRVINSAAVLGAVSFFVLVLGGTIISARQQCFKEGDALLVHVFPLSEAITGRKLAYALALFKSGSADEMLSQIEFQNSLVGIVFENPFFGKLRSELKQMAAQIEFRMNRDELLLTTSPFDDRLPDFETDIELIKLEKNPLAREQAFQRLKKEAGVLRATTIKDNSILNARPDVYVDCSVSRIVRRWISGEQSVLGLQARKSTLVWNRNGGIEFAPGIPQPNAKVIP